MAGATVDTGTFPLSAPQKPLNTPCLRPVAMMRLTADRGVPTISTPRTSASSPVFTSTRNTMRGTPLKAW